jgi:hypothetical protein
MARYINDKIYTISCSQLFDKSRSEKAIARMGHELARKQFIHTIKIQARYKKERQI